MGAGMRVRAVSTLLPLLALAVACAPDDSALGRINLGGSGSGSPGSGATGTGNNPGAQTSGGLSGSVPKDSPSPAATHGAGGSQPTASPTATPASPAPSYTPYVPYALRVTVSPATASINLPGPQGNSAGYLMSVQLRAEVLLSDAATVSAVRWVTGASSSALVGADGLVTAQSATGDILLWAVSADGMASGSCRLQVTADTAVDLTIE